MQISDTIEQFMFDSAQYRISDRQGNKVLLKINYADNHYAIEELAGELNPRFKQELARIATSLLRRKRGVNFARKG